MRSEAVLDIDSIYTDYLYFVSVPDSIDYPDSTLLNYPDSVPEVPLNVYSMYVGSDIPNTVFNIFFEEFADGTLSDPYVLMYRMDSTFAEAYYSNSLTFYDFVGTVSKHEMEVMFGDIFRGGGDLAYLAKCWEMVFGEPLDIEITDYTPPGSGSPGGGGTDPESWPGVSVTIISNPSPKLPPGGCVRIIEIYGSVYIYWDEGCNDDLDKPSPYVLWGGNNNPPASRGPYIECIRLLMMCGFLDKPFTPDPSQLTEAELLTIKLGYDINDPDFDDIVICLHDHKALMFAVQDLLNSLSDPCNSSNTPEGMIRDALDVACSSESPVEALQNHLHNQSNALAAVLDNGFSWSALAYITTTSNCCNDAEAVAECIWDGFLDEADLTSQGFTQEEIDFIYNSEIPTLGSKVEIKPIDWTVSNADQRANHMFKWLVFINWVHSCIINNQPDNGNVTYNINDFFTNITGLSSGGYGAQVTLNVKLDGNEHTIPGVGFEYTNTWTTDDFYWGNGIQGNSDTNNTHFFFYRKESLPQWTNAIINFIVPSAGTEIVNLALNRPCN